MLTQDNRFMLFALGATRPLGERIAARLGCSLALHEERDFEDGEHKTRSLVSVRNRDVFVLHSLYSDTEHSVNDKLIRFLFFLGSLRDAGARRVIALAPLLAYARKDQKSQTRDPVTTRYVARMFEAVDVDMVLTLDVHNLAAFQNAYRCSTEHIEATRLFAAHFAKLVADRPVAVVAPDAGGIKRAERFRRQLAEDLGRPVSAAFAEKHRALGVVSGEAFVGDVRDRVAIIIDDLIASGTTLLRTAKACLGAGASEVRAAATHGLFVGGANDTLGDPAIRSITVTDTVSPYRVTAPALREKLVVLSVAELLAAAIEELVAADYADGRRSV